MAINIKKSQIIQLKFSKHSKHKSNIGSIGGLKVVKQYKYLGVDFDETLSFHSLLDKLDTKFQHFQLYVQRLKLNKIPLRVRFNLFQTYV